MRAVTFDREKFQNLVLYIAKWSADHDDERFGLTKLNKVLYFSDFKAFGILGSSITGASYMRLSNGPVAQQLLVELRELERLELTKRTERQYFNYKQKRVEALAEPDLSDFTEDEVAIVDTVLRDLYRLNASEVSELSHLEIGWQLAHDREEISYSTVYISDRPLSEGDVEFAEEHRYSRGGWAQQ